MSPRLIKVLLTANLTMLGGALATTPAPAGDSAPGQSVKQVSSYELLTTGSMFADRADRGECGPPHERSAVSVFADRADRGECGQQVSC